MFLSPELLIPWWFVVAAGFVLGATVGSYLATIVWRWPRGESANAGRSRCEGCGRVLPWYDLVPIVGYFVTRARCRVCGYRVPIDHLLFEIACAAIGAAFFAAGSWWLAPLGWLLVALAVFDARYLRLPDPLVAAFAVIALIAPPFEPLGYVERMIGGAIGFLAFWAIALTYRRLRRREGLGFGDVKLFGAIGLWVGPWALPSLLLAACLIGFADLAMRAARGGAWRDARLPLGTYLALATIGFAAWHALR